VQCAAFPDQHSEDALRPNSPASLRSSLRAGRISQFPRRFGIVLATTVHSHHRAQNHYRAMTGLPRFSMRSVSAWPDRVFCSAVKRSSCHSPMSAQAANDLYQSREDDSAHIGIVAGIFERGSQFGNGFWRQAFSTLGRLDGHIGDRNLFSYRTFFKFQRRRPGELMISPCNCETDRARIGNCGAAPRMRFPVRFPSAKTIFFFAIRRD